MVDDGVNLVARPDFEQGRIPAREIGGFLETHAHFVEQRGVPSSGAGVAIVALVAGGQGVDDTVAVVQEPCCLAVQLVAEPFDVVCGVQDDRGACRERALDPGEQLVAVAALEVGVRVRVPRQSVCDGDCVRNAPRERVGDSGFAALRQAADDDQWHAAARECGNASAPSGPT